MSRAVKGAFPWLVLLACLAAFGAAPRPQDVPERIPALWDVENLRVQIIDATFVTELEGVLATFSETQLDEYRGLVLTLRIDKPAGKELRLNAPDVALHYYYGDDFDVTPCFGLSTFSTVKDTDRMMKLFMSGHGSASTGLSTMNAETIYVDVFFQNMEPDTRDLYLLVAQPVGAHFKTEGWK